MPRLAVALAALAPVLLLPGVALAQQGGFDAHGFDLVTQDGDVRDATVVERPGALERASLFVGGALEYANRPLVLVTERSSSDDLQIDRALDHVLALNVTGGWVPHERIRLTARMPLYLTSTGREGTQGPAGGDLRLDAMLLAVDPRDNGIGVGVVPWIDLPTGATRRFLGRRTVGGGLAVAGTREWTDWTATANLGVQLEPSIDLENLTGADALIAAVSVNRLLDERQSIGLEARTLAPFAANERAWTGSPAEVIASYRRRADSGAFLLGGLAAPLSPGAGAAAFRVFVGGGFGRTGPAEPKDTDLDGITDDLDACPEQPETDNGYIDEDGCPDELATLAVDVTWRGEPVDGAELVVTGPEGEERADTTVDTRWQKQVLPDTMWKIVATKGQCLRGEAKKLVDEGEHEVTIDLKLVPSATLRVKVTDASGTPIPSARLLWETETPECVPEPPSFDTDGIALTDLGPGVHKIVVGAPGYRVVEVPVLASPGDEIPVDVVLQPTKLRVEKRRIVILEKVQFEFNRAVIKDASFELLDEVAEVIKRNPQAGRVEVQGHTDSRGSDAYNQKLSQRRSEAVREYLVDKGVDPERLVAKGYGETTPIADNDTESGRALNRRVEFVLVDQDEQQIEESVPEDEAGE